MNENMQYTEEWFEKAYAYVNCKDLKAVKERLGHLTKMMDELNELWHEDEKLKELEWEKYFLRYLLNTSYGALKQIKPNEGLLNDIQKEYREVKQQLKKYKAD